MEITEDDLSLKIVHTEQGHGSVRFDSELMSAAAGNAETVPVAGFMPGHSSGRRVSRKGPRTAEQGLPNGFARHTDRYRRGAKLYIAIGFQRIQHMTGAIRNIVAINTDPHAPDFYNHYYNRQCRNGRAELAAALRGKDNSSTQTQEYENSRKRNRI